MNEMDRILFEHIIKILFISFFAWVVSQAIKTVLSLRKDGLQLRDAVTSGGMPSSHAAVMTSFLTSQTIYTFQLNRDTSGSEIAQLASWVLIFSIIITAVVIYDATHVRRTAGEAARAVYHLHKKLKIPLDKPLYAAQGHTPSQVLIGALLGVVVSLLFVVLWQPAITPFWSL